MVMVMFMVRRHSCLILSPLISGEVGKKRGHDGPLDFWTLE